MEVNKKIEMEAFKQALANIFLEEEVSIIFQKLKQIFEKEEEYVKKEEYEELGRLSDRGKEYIKK